jgi:hypothetical protein
MDTICWAVNFCIYAVGYYLAFKILVWIAYEVYALAAPRLNLRERYGAGTWVAITGGSHGIGYGFAEEFANMGFNIILIARNQEKLSDAANRLADKYKVEV